MLPNALEIKHQLVAWRRDYHSHPELGFNEHRTAESIAQILTQIGCRVQTGVGRTGVIGEIGNGLPVFAIRADMDALPMDEKNSVPYVSVHPGVMHACGHDAHIAMALGAASLLAKQSFPGTVRFLFQPAEEIADAEGLSGAPRMVEQGALENVSGVIALHVSSHLETGKIQISAGPSSAGVDTFRGKVIGQGGHGARPHETIDPFVLASHVILALNAIVSRRLDPFAPAVVSLGAIHGGHAENVIPEEIHLDGTIRFMDIKIQKQIHNEIQRAFSLTRILGGEYELKFEIGNLPMTNHPGAVRLITQVATEMIGGENISPHDQGMGAEDFGVFTDIVPGAMFVLGCRIEGDERSHHNPTFDVDEACLPLGAAILAEAAVQFLINGGYPGS